MTLKKKNYRFDFDFHFFLKNAALAPGELKFLNGLNNKQLFLNRRKSQITDGPDRDASHILLLKKIIIINREDESTSIRLKDKFSFWQKQIVHVPFLSPICPFIEVLRIPHSERGGTRR